MAARLVVGLDLDLTLIDSKPGIAAALRALSDRTGVFIDADAAVTRLGPPLDVELALWFPAEQVPAIGDEVRRLYPTTAVTPAPAPPRAPEAFSAGSARGGPDLFTTGE